MKINALEDDEQLRDLGLSVFHTTTHTFSATSAPKIVENHLGRAFIKSPDVQAQPTLQIELPRPPTPGGLIVAGMAGKRLRYDDLIADNGLDSGARG